MAQKEKVVGSNELGEPVNLQTRVKVWATKEAPYHKEGQEVNVAPTVAKKMVANGWATDKAPAKK